MSLCHAPLVQAEARLSSTRNSVTQKEGQNFSYLAFLPVSINHFPNGSRVRGAFSHLRCIYIEVSDVYAPFMLLRLC